MNIQTEFSLSNALGIDFTAFGWDAYDELVSVLDGCSTSSDSMAHSAGYLLHTGRGLVYIARRAHEVAVLLAHPNVEQSMLVLPAGAEPAVNLWRDLIIHCRAQSQRVTLGRVTPELLDVAHSLDGFKAVPETVLDWALPVKIIDTELTSKTKNKPFKKFRHKIRQAEKIGEIEVVDQGSPLFERFRGKTIEMFQRWANDVAESKKISIDHLISSNLAALDLAEKALPCFNFYIFTCNEKVVGFEVIELPCNSDIANGISKCRDPEHTNISVYMEKYVSTRVLAQGFKKRNINGSENDKLNYYRETVLRPIESIQLQTFDYLTD